MVSMMVYGVHDGVWCPYGVVSTHHPQNGHERVVEQLLKANADVNRATDDGSTPLHMASQVCIEMLMIFQ